MIQCRECNASFTPSTSRQVYCTPKCRSKHKRTARMNSERPACAVAGCESTSWAKGYCNMHYQRFTATGSTGPAEALRSPQSPVCEVEGCETPTSTKTARSMCSTHYRKWRRELHNSPCSVDGCDNLADDRASLLCAMHYQRRRINGDPGPGERKRRAGGSWRPNENGYMFRIVPGSRELRSNGKYSLGKVELQHRRLMEDLIGRPLLRSETVHHVNGDRADNRVDGPLDENFRSGNLELWSSYQPSGQRVVDKVNYAVDILRQYAPELLAET